MKSKRSKTSVEKPKSKKPLKTYGKSSQDIFDFQGGSDGELDIRSSMETGQKLGKRKRIDHSKVDHAASRRGSQEDVTRRPITSSGEDTKLLSTSSKSHETSSVGEKGVYLQGSMAPPASKSTVFEQSQRSQTEKISIIADSAYSESTTSNVISPVGGNYSGTDSHDPMSAPSGLGCTEVDRECPPDLAHSVKFGSMHADGAMNRADLQPIDEPAPSSSASKISRSETITVKRTSQAKNAFEKLTSHLDSEHLDKPFARESSAMSKPVMPLSGVLETEGTQDELSLSIPEAVSRHATAPAKALKRSMETNNETVNELDFEDHDIGIPKERYQPRPSKRRSGAGDGEILVPVDFSKRPEAIGKGKRKTKRHKTTAFQELLPPDEDEDEEIKVVPNPRFEIPEKKPPKTSTEEDRLDAGKNDCTDQSRPESESEPKQTAKSTGQKKRGRPKKVVTNLSEEIVVDKAEGEHDQDNTETEEPIIPATTKKSQKRTKSKELPAPIIDERNGNDDNTPIIENDPEDPPTNILGDSNNNINRAAKPSSATSPPLKANPPPETPRKPTTPAPKGPDKHSPISSGKVAFRVGLSKRARIAPLLRIVRK